MSLPSSILHPLSSLKRWGSFVRFSHTVFALPFALAAMLVAARDNRGWPGWRVFGLILAAMVCARTCAMAFNRIADRKFDALNPRTKNRHLPAGEISLFSASLLCALSAAGLIVASWFLNPLCFYLSPVALVAVCFYSLTKRFTDYTHVFLGIALALAPVGAWLAVKGADVSRPEIGQMTVLAAAVVLWLVGFDIIYALQDYEFDKSHGLRSLVVAWGPQNALSAAFLAHMVMCGLLFGFGFLCKFRLMYLVGWLVILLCLVLEHWIARRRGLNWINLAFFRLNALVGVVFLVAVAVEVIFKGGFRLR
ncbi:MAG TPA: UbiA-like polyprenyltransferase [Candidatus Acidoferrales bacterium]|jgi:4-hydroxybenzoate polyprenyltransferase|nr:UbiA-like polyprenyltransferase [Candidatus Acidoferrales bacterium]